MELTPYTPQSHPFRILFMSSYVPRECGIATYTEDVLRAVEPQGADCQVIAMEQPDHTYPYDRHVFGTITDNRLQDYLTAADMINHSWFDVLSLQHEFGIYGGDASEDVVRFLDAVRIPVVVTFHTIVRNPSPSMRHIQHAIAERATAIVVMNGLAPDVLHTVYDVDTQKIHVIPHGAPVPSRPRDACFKWDLGLEGRQVFSTFGLIVPAKGLEYMVAAMPRIVREQPNAMYYILGQTHPVLRQQYGEEYRVLLEDTARELGVQDHVRFIDRYLTKDELVHYLLATDVYVTPYLNMEQITSGTLAYAIGAGCPVVSTPYLHAQYLLNQGNGILVPPYDAGSLAEAGLRILGNPDLQRQMQHANWALGQTLLWPRVGSEYLQVFRQAASHRSTSDKT